MGFSGMRAALCDHRGGSTAHSHSHRHTHTLTCTHAFTRPLCVCVCVCLYVETHTYTSEKIKLFFLFFFRRLSGMDVVGLNCFYGNYSPFTPFGRLSVYVCVEPYTCTTMHLNTWFSWYYTQNMWRLVFVGFAFLCWSQQQPARYDGWVLWCCWWLIRKNQNQHGDICRLLLCLWREGM